MYRLKVQHVGNGQHPSEVVVSVRTADGIDEELIVDAQSIKNGSVRVGYPIVAQDSRFLVELPRETLGGKWRVWVEKGNLVENRA